jgi:5-methylcytosine-specific restriction protein A
MPYAPPHPCGYPGCAVLVKTRDSRCEGHRTQEQKKFELQRCSAATRGYGSRWRAARSAFLRNNPLCVECQKKGILKAATVVDHIVPHKGDQGLFWDQSNWQALCAHCHSRKTAEKDGRWGKKSDATRYS